MWEYTPHKIRRGKLCFNVSHKDEMHFKVNKANKEETKPAVAYDCNLNIEAVDLKDQMLQPYFFEQKKGSEWCMKLFKRFLSITSCKSMIIYQSMPNSKGRDLLKFRLLLI
jgi:hypothetical protein